MVEVCGYVFICFYIGFTRSKNITMPYCAAFGCTHHLAKYRELKYRELKYRELKYRELKYRVLKYRELKYRELKPEAVQTIFQLVPQPKASTTHKHLIKRIVARKLVNNE